MVRPLAALALGLALGASGCTLGRGTQQEPLVAGLEVKGVRSVSASELAAKLATQAPVRRPGLAGLLVKDRQRLDPDALAIDRRRIEAYYRERGFYGAHVTDVSVTPAGKGLVRVVFRVDEGQPVHVASVTIRGLDEAPEAAARLGKLPLRAGEPFTEGEYDATRSQLLGALLSTGWATAEVVQNAVVIPEAGTAEVTYDVKPGPRFRFGPIFVAGTSQVSRERVREEAAVAVHTGDFWNEGALARAQSRIFELGIFGGVRVTRGTPDARRGTIPVVVAVREAPFRTIRAGPGITFEVLRWDASAMFGWEHRNFYGGLRHVSVDLRTGYTWVPTPLSPRKDGVTAFLGTELRQPGAITRYVDASARVELERGILDPYDFLAQRLRLSLPVRLGGGWTFVPSYNLEVNELSNTSVDPTSIGGAPPTEGTPVLENCKANGVCLLTYLEERLAWDRRDNPVNTRRGVYVSLAVQQGFETRGYGYRYLRFLPEVRGFYPLWRGAVLAGRARIGALLPVSEPTPPPLVSRFLAGGPFSMRGYYTNRLAYMVRQKSDWVPLGGNGLADGSLELRLDATPSLGTVLFFDAGAVAEPSADPSRWKDVLNPANFQFAGGVGLRYRTPFGPLRLDVAARLPKNFCTAASCFPAVPGIGGPVKYDDGTLHREPILAVHLALGEAF